MPKSIIDLIYTAAIDDAALSELAPAIVAALDGQACWLQRLGPGETTTLFGHGLEAQATNVTAIRAAPAGKRGGDGRGEDGSAGPASLPAPSPASGGPVHSLSADFFVEGEHYAFCVRRASGRAPFLSAEERRLQELLPHLKRALFTRSRLRGQLRRIEQLEALLGQHPLFLVTDRLEVQWMVQGTFPPLDSIYLAERGRSVILCARSPDLQARLTHAVARAMRDGDGSGDVIESSEWTAFIDHYPSSESDQLATIRFVDKREQIRRVTSVAQRRHDLTRAEAALCASLLDGESLQEHASTHGIRISTARSHLKTLLAKTGTSRQGEVVALLSRYSAASH